MALRAQFMRMSLNPASRREAEQHNQLDFRPSFSQHFAIAPKHNPETASRSISAKIDYL